MNIEEFLRKNLRDQLQKRGYDPSAAEAGIRHYKRMTGAKNKGKAFDECLDAAIIYAGKKVKK